MELASRYELVRRLGEGGMGVVHEALDKHLGRHVAIKMIRDGVESPAARERFFREARAAAAISHPNVCLLHEVGEHDGQPFLVMELLHGEPLSARLARGALPLGEALEIVLPVLSALGALHARGLIHRDLKPSNVFLTPHGVKLLDFGLARHVTRHTDVTTTALTQEGVFSGTPRYMAPEQIAGDPLDGRADIFALGIVLYELVTGRPPFDGRSTVEMLHAILRQDPPPTGRPELSALEPILRRALQRRADDRYASVEAMAADLRPLVRAAASHHPQPAPQPAPAARVVVLPFRLLKADDEIGFLESALPDAITTSLAAVPSLCVRSNVAALRFGGSADLAAVATALDVDHVLTGTLLRSGSQIRVTSQLVEMPGGRVRWSQTVQRPLGDLFELQDTISHHIVDSLPLDARTPSRTPDMPATPRAYELYLRANHHALDARGWTIARHLYEACLAEDPQFAPAWAQLGRVQRIIGKYVEQDFEPFYAAAEQAFQKAFAINPDLSLAHHLYVYQEVETGRAAEALIRLANRIDRHPNQAELYAALCQAARYCGLLEVSVAAHERARALDPHVRTSVANTYLALENYPALVQAAGGISDSLVGMALYEMGASWEEVVRAIDAELGGSDPESQTGTFRRVVIASLTKDRDTVKALCEKFLSGKHRFPDGEALYTMARMLARTGWRERALEALQMAVDAGFVPASTFARDRWLDTIRDAEPFGRILAAARERSLAADAAFQAVGGYRLLGLTPPSNA